MSFHGAPPDCGGGGEQKYKNVEKTVWDRLTWDVSGKRAKNIEKGVTAENSNSLAFLHGWAVNPQTGEARGDVLKREKLLVRLVCEIK